MSDRNEEKENQSPRSNKALIWVAGALISLSLGFAIAWLGSQGSVKVGGFPVFALIVGFAFVINWGAFVPSFLAHTEKYFDITGALTYITVTVVALTLSGSLDMRSWIAGAMVIIWAVRLGSFLFLRIKRDGRDSRFDEMKYDFLQYFMTWTIQGLWVSLTAAAAFAIITAEVRVDFGLIGFLGLAIWLVGISIEALADHQKSKFKADPANQGAFISTGLWAWSRHPNYFGEILLWSGVAILAVPVLSGWRWAVLISPLFVFMLLTKVSGIPMLRKRADERWGDDPEYQAYLKRTSLLVPLPPKR